jgi:hypothetical protein
MKIRKVYSVNTDKGLFIGSMRECRTRVNDESIKRVQVQRIVFCECGHNNHTMRQYTHGGVCFLCGGKI